MPVYIAPMSESSQLRLDTPTRLIARGLPDSSTARTPGVFHTNGNASFHEPLAAHAGEAGDETRRYDLMVGAK